MLELWKNTSLNQVEALEEGKVPSLNFQTQRRVEMTQLPGNKITECARKGAWHGLE